MVNLGLGLTLEAVIWLLLLAIVVAAVTKRLAVPYTVALVVVGLGLGYAYHKGFTGIGHEINLTPTSIFVLFLPPLLFQAAIEIPWRGLRRNLWHVLALAVGGVMLNLYLVGWGVRLVLGVPLSVALVFGAIVAATDPTAVVALFRDLRVDRRLTLLIEAESLLNDGVAATVFLVVTAAAIGPHSTPGGAVILFIRQALGGVACGAILGWLMGIVTGHVDDVLIETSLTLVLAYGSYLVAERLGLSGMLSVVSAGIMVGNYGLPSKVHPEIRDSIEQFWQFASFLANSLLFLLIGFKAVSLARLFEWPADLALTGIILLCRAIVVFTVVSTTRVVSEKIPLKWHAVLTWGGLRGAVSIALALGLPADLPDRQRILGWVYATTMITLLVQGPTVRYLIQWFKIPCAQKPSPPTRPAAPPPDDEE